MNYALVSQDIEMLTDHNFNTKLKPEKGLSGALIYIALSSITDPF